MCGVRGSVVMREKKSSVKMGRFFLRQDLIKGKTKSWEKEGGKHGYVIVKKGVVKGNRRLIGRCMEMRKNVV